MSSNEYGVNVTHCFIKQQEILK